MCFSRLIYLGDLILVFQDGNTALLIASHCGHIKCVELLTIAGATVDIQNKV